MWPLRPLPRTAFCGVVPRPFPAAARCASPRRAGGWSRTGQGRAARMAAAVTAAAAAGPGVPTEGQANEAASIPGSQFERCRPLRHSRGSRAGAAAAAAAAGLVAAGGAAATQTPVGEVPRTTGTNPTGSSIPRHLRHQPDRHRLRLRRLLGLRLSSQCSNLHHPRLRRQPSCYTRGQLGPHPRRSRGQLGPLPRRSRGRLGPRLRRLQFHPLRQLSARTSCQLLSAGPRTRRC